MALITAKELAAELHCSPSTVYQFARAGKIPSVKIGDLYRFNLDRVLSALESSNAPAATESPSTFRRKTAT